MSNEPTFEFCKLDEVDLKVTTWLFCKCPHALYSYLDFISKNDYRRKGVSINANKIFNELIEVRKTNLTNPARDMKQQ